MKDVLLNEETITVPGFGTFETTYQSAQLDEKSGVIHPPTKLVKLNVEKKDDPDNKLVTYLTQKLAISDVDAKAIIDDFVKSANAKLAEKSNLMIDEVGILKTDEAGNPVLEGVQSKLSIDNYGMDTIEVEPVAAADRVAAPVAAATSKGKTAKPETKTTTKVQTTKVTTTETKTVAKEEKKKDRKLLKLLSILLPILAILTILFFIFKEQIMGFINGSNSKPETENVISNNDPVPDDLNVLEQEDPEIVALEDNNGTTDPDLAILAKAGFSNVSPQDLGSKYKKYYLVGGSFRDKDNANKVKREIKATEILKADNSEYYRVIIIGSDSAQEIVDAYNLALNRGLKSSELWLLKNSKNNN